MDIFHNRLISLKDREKGWGPGYWVLGAFLLLSFLSVGPDPPRASDHPQADQYVTTWLTKEKAAKIMRYHGADGLKITEDRVYIKRDGSWICVYRDASSLPEKDVREDPGTVALRVEGDDS